MSKISAFRSPRFTTRFSKIWQGIDWEWTRFNKYMYRYWKKQAVVTFLGFVSIPLGLLYPQITRLVIDEAFTKKNWEMFFLLALAGAAAFLVTALIGSVSGYLSSALQKRVHADLAKDTFRHIQSLPFAYFQNNSTGSVLFHMNRDVGAVSGFVTSILPQLIQTIPNLIFTLAVICYLNWKLAIVAGLMVPFTYIHPLVFGKKLKRAAEEVVEVSSLYYRKLVEAFQRAHLIKTFGKEKEERNAFENRLEARIDSELSQAKCVAVSQYLSGVLNKILTGIIGFYGGYQVMTGQLSLGSLTAVMMYAGQLLGIFRSFANLYERILVSSVSRKRLSEVLAIPSQTPDRPDARDCRIAHGRIEFKNVWFSYDKESNVLRNTNLVVEAGTKAAIIGRSGCGKTTAFSLILRLHELDEGSILIDGVDLRDIKRNSLNSQLGLVLQQPFLWDDTIAENISYGAPNASPEDIARVCRIAAAHDFIMELPNAYNTVIGDEGCKLSGGQKQRIALARVLLRHPRVLLLDEALSSVDTETEKTILDNILREYADLTILVASHRSSTVEHMDVSFSFEDGSFVKGDLHEKTSSPRIQSLHV